MLLGDNTRFGLWPDGLVFDVGRNGIPNDDSTPGQDGEVSDGMLRDGTAADTSREDGGYTWDAWL